MVGFDGFRGIVDDIGGVRMKITQPVYDPTGSGAKLDPGNQWLGPLNALAFVRTRHSFANGDIDRSHNQAAFLLAMLRELREDMGKSPARLMDWMAITRKSLGKSSTGLIGIRLQKSMVELSPPGAISSSGKPLPCSS